MQSKWLSRVLAVALAAPLVNCSDFAAPAEPARLADELEQLLSGQPVISVDGDWTTTLQQTGSTVALRRECKVATDFGRLPNVGNKGEVSAWPIAWWITCGCAPTIEPPWWLTNHVCKLTSCSLVPTQSCNYKCEPKEPPPIIIG